MDQRYEFVRDLGEGGQGRVVLVRDNFRQGDLVALKRMSDAAFGQRLEVEFHRLADMRHPNLARAYDFSRDDEGPYFTSEFVDGIDIVTWSKRADEKLVVPSMAALLRALALLHDRDLVHGDLSPGNVLISKPSTDFPVLKLLDLGSACRPGDRPAATTAGFTAPEVLSGEGFRVSSDLYSFGVLLAHVMFNKSPFGTGDASKIVGAQLEGKVDLPDPDTSPVAGVCLRLLDKDLSRRPKSAKETISMLADATNVDLSVGFSDLRGGDLPPPKIVGRRTELASLTAVLDKLDDERGDRVQRVTGPMGSGKSTALQECIKVAQLSGFRVIGQSETRATTESLLKELAVSLEKQNPESLCFAAARALENAAKEKPVLVAIDDLERSEHLVQSIIAAFARCMSKDRAARPAAVMVVTRDIRESDQGWRDLGGPEISLEPISKNAVEALVASMLPGISYDSDLAESVYLASKGWPGSAEQFVRQAAGSKVRGDLEARTRERIKEIDGSMRKVLAALSYMSLPCQMESLSDIDGTRDSIDRLLKLGFLKEKQGTGGAFVQVSPSIGKAALEQVGDSKVKPFVKELAGKLERGGFKEQTAELLLAVDDKTAAVRVLGSLATDCLERGDSVGAGEWFEKALGAAPKESDIEELARSAVATWRNLGEYDLALENLARTGFEEADRAQLELELTFQAGLHLEALDMVASMASESRNEMRVLKVVAEAEMQLGRHEQSLSTVEKALGSPGEEEVLGGHAAELALSGATACTYLGRVGEARGLLKRASLGFDKAGDEFGRIRVLSTSGMLARRRGDLKEARSFYDLAVSAAKQLGDKRLEGLHLMNRATVAIVSGDIASAYEDYLESLDIAVVLGHEFATAQVEVNLADLLSGLGAQKDAIKTAASAIVRCRALGQGRLESRALLMSGVALLRTGALHRAERRLKEARRKFEASSDDVGQLATDLYTAELRLKRGDLKEAFEVAKRAASVARKQDRPGHLARALILKARSIGGSKKEIKKALGLLEEARGLLESESLPDEAWRLEYHHAKILELAGESARANSALKSARAGFESVQKRVPAEFQESFAGFGEARGLFGEDPAEENRGLGGDDTSDLERLMEINRELTRERNLKRLLELIMTHAVELTGAERGMVVMQKGEAFEPVISHQISDGVDLSFSRSVAEKVVAEGRAILAIDALGDDRFRAFESVHTMKLRSILSVPLRVRQDIVGVIYLDSRLRAGVFKEGDRNLLEAFGAQAAIALETARLISENAKRCEDLEQANDEIKILSGKLEEKLKHNEAKLKRVGALLNKTQKEEADRLRENGIIGRSRAMQQVMHMIERIALADVPVYIFGASGTGKELVAKAVHAESERAEYTFVPVNCGALPPKLLASELFGHQKGAFTGAVGDRPGLFRLAHQGTLFLDEVSNMDAEMQAYLLRVLQDGTFRALGGNEEISVDVRIISASNRDLEEEVKQGRFREDLFYRLNVVRIDVPPLGDRPEDIPLLVDHFARQLSGDGEKEFSKEALDCLMGAEWPGNVRELENEVLRAITMAPPDSPIRVNDLSPRLVKAQTPSTQSGTGTLKQRVDGFERVIIQQVLTECADNATKAAKRLGISRAGLYKKLEKHSMGR